MADVGEKGDARLLKVGKVVGVVDNAHCIRLDESHPYVVGELVIGGVNGRFGGQAHPPIFAPRRPSSPVIETERRHPSRIGGPSAGILELMTPAIALLEHEAVAFVAYEYDSGDELRDFGREAAEALGLAYDQVFKTLLINVDGERDPVVAVIPVSCMVSMKLVAAAVNGKKAAMCDPADAERVTGYVVGGISPLGQRKRLRTVLDETVGLFDTVYVSGGRRGLDIALDPADLARLLNATIAPITA